MVDLDSGDGDGPQRRRINGKGGRIWASEDGYEPREVEKGVGGSELG